VIEEIPLTLVLDEGMVAGPATALGFVEEDARPLERAAVCRELSRDRFRSRLRELDNRIHPKSHISERRGLLPEKYSLLRANGDGLQSVYLAEVGRPFAEALLRLMGGEANKIADVADEVDRKEQ
jgi:hypothetical protein